MPYAPLPDDATLDASSGGGSYTPLPSNAQLDAPQQISAWYREPLLAASNALKGMTGAIGTSGEAEAGMMGMPDDETPTPQTVEKGLTDAGAINRPDLVPQNLAEKGVASASRGVGQALPFAAFGPASAVISGAGGGIGGDVAEAEFPNHPVLAQTLGNMAGGVGAAGLTSIPFLSDIAKGPVQALARTFIPGAKSSQAVSKLAQAMQQDIDSGAVTIQDFQNAQLKGLQPWELDDAENTRALAGAITRSGGPARTTMRAYAKAQDAAAPGRLDAALNDAAGVNGVNINDTAESIAAAQQKAARPLYDKAMAGGSIAPLQTQFENAFNDASAAEQQAMKDVQAAQNNATLSAAQVSRAGDNVYANASALPAQRSAASALEDAQARLAAAQAQKQQVLDKLRQAQGDASANAPGAVWSPRLQQFLDDPILQQGLQKGAAMQRLEAIGQNEPFNPREWGITGADPQGNPVVSQVPNMRMLDMGKRGLDAIVRDNTDPITGKMTDFGRSVSIFRKGYVNELDNLNPDYAPARAAWSGPAQSLNAIQLGKTAMTKPPQQIASELGTLSPSDQQLYRVSAIQNSVSPKMNAGTPGSDESLRLLANSPDKLKPQLEALLPDQAAQQKVLSAAQQAYFKKKAMGAISGNSATIERGMDQLALNGGESSHPVGKLALGAGAAELGHPVIAGYALLRALGDAAKKAVGGASPAVNQRIAKMMTTANPATLEPVFGRLTPPGPRVPLWPVPILGSSASIPPTRQDQRIPGSLAP